MDFILLFLVVVFFWAHGAYSGWKAREEYARKITEKLLDHIQGEVKKTSEDLIHITIEEHSGVFYVYNKDDKTFMAQGKSKQELEDVLSARFPGKRFAASQEELQKAGLLS